MPMAIFVVCRRALLRELLTTYCTSKGLEVDASFEQLPDAWDSPADATFILHTGAGDSTAIEDVRTFRNRVPKAQIIVLASAYVIDEIEQHLHDVVEAILPDDSSPQMLTGVLTVVDEGFRVSLPGKPGRPAGRAPAPSVVALHDRELDDIPADHAASPTPPVGLSAREITVIRKLREGASNKDIARDLQIVESTVKVHLRACYRKIGVRNRTQAAIWAANNLPG